MTSTGAMYCVANTHTWYTDTHHTSVAAGIKEFEPKVAVIFAVFGEGAFKTPTSAFTLKN